MSYEIIKSDKALIPTKQVGSTYILYCLYKEGYNTFSLDITPYIKRKFKYFLTQGEMLAKQFKFNTDDFSKMITFLVTDDRIPEKYRAKTIFLERKFSLQQNYLRTMEKQIKRLEKQKKIKFISEKSKTKLYHLQSIISKHKDLVICQVVFTQQLISLLEQKYPNENPIQIYVNFLKEYTRKEGEDLNKYIKDWARRLMVEHNIATEEELEEGDRNKREYQRIWQLKHKLKKLKKELKNYDN